MNVFFLTKAGYNTPSSRLRAFQLADVLRARGHRVEVTPRVWDAKRTGLGRCLRRARAFVEDLRCLARANRDDVVIVQRTVDRQESIVAALVWRGLRRGRLVFDFDDAVFHGHPVATRIITRYADAVFAGSRALLKYAQAQGGRAHYVPTGVRIEQYRPEPPSSDHNRFVVGWVGHGPDYIGELELLAQPLSELNERLPVRFVCIGTMGHRLVNELLDRFAASGVVVDRFDWMDPSQIASRIASFDVGVMPLRSIERNICKCGLKLLEYMAMAIPVVASPVGENRTIIEHGRTGLLADTPQEWTSALETLARQPDLARRLGEEGRKTVERRYSLSEIGRIVEATLSALTREAS